MKETDVGAAVVTLLAESGFDVYQEVLLPSAECCDIVATRGKLVVAVECKVTLNFKVMHQALRWIPHAHHSYVAAPSTYLDPLARRLLEDLGLGFIQVGGMHESWRAEYRLDAHMNRRADDRLRKSLCEEQKTHAPAGSSGGTRWSSFKSTVQNLQRVVRDKPGITMQDAVESIRHHYASSRAARSGLVHWIDKGIIEGIRVEREGKTPKLYPVQIPFARKVGAA